MIDVIDKRLTYFGNCVARVIDKNDKLPRLYLLIKLIIYYYLGTRVVVIEK